VLVGGVGVGVWGVVLVVCVCVSGVLFSVGVCVCDLLNFLHRMAGARPTKLHTELAHQPNTRSEGDRNEFRLTLRVKY